MLIQIIKIARWLEHQIIQCQETYQKQREAGLAAKEDTQLPLHSYLELHFQDSNTVSTLHLFQHVNIPLSVL